MCGIIGYLGQENGITKIIDGLKILQNRGYDSAGISCIDPRGIEYALNQPLVYKFASTNTNNSISKIEETFSETFSKNVIGHTRWATHGGKTDANAHPHMDNRRRISLVHNGIIENYQELKTQLKIEGYEFLSQTDTEVAAVMIGKYLDEGNAPQEAIQKTLDVLKGTWAFMIHHVDYPNKIWITRNGSPILIGMDADFAMIVSESTAFGNYINQYVVLENHDLIEISQEKTKDGHGIRFNKDIQKYAIKNTDYTNVETLPNGYAHWMIKEIMEQPECVKRVMNNGGRVSSNVTVMLGGLDVNKTQLMELNHLILLGCGTSYHSGLWSLEIFKTMDIFDTVSIYDGADFQIRDIPKKGNVGAILLSQSGETKDLHRCIQIANDYDIITIGVVNVVDSLIARETACGVYLNAGREVSVASTKSFTNQCVALSMIATWFSQNRGTAIEKRKKILSDMRNLPIQMNTLLEHHHTDIYSMAKQLLDTVKLVTNLFVLGKGSGYSIALEGALKIKEVTYIHAEGYSASALKHGPFAIIEDNTPIILLDLENEMRDKIDNTYQEIAARNAYIIFITNRDQETTYPNTIYIEYNKTYGGLIGNMVIQLFSYYISVMRGLNPDYPRNLAKVVTVE